VKSRWWWRLNGCRWRGPMSPAAVDEEEVVSCWWWERKEIVVGVPLLMKIEEEARSRELLRRSSSLLMKRKSRPWALMTGPGVRKEKEWRLDRDRDRFCGDRRRRFCGCRCLVG
jgi:hypothetical protein